MIDDMDGLFSHASDAYRAGIREGRNKFYTRLLVVIGRIGSRHEKADNVSAFHAVEECTAAIRGEKHEADEPQTLS